MPTSTNSLLDELVTFIQHQIPGLEDGEYQLTVSQRIEDSAGNTVSTDSIKSTYKFAVLGDRFGFTNPAEAMTSVFPPSNATGEFTLVLPHVVFAHPAIPWSRSAAVRENFDPPSAAGGGAVVDHDVPTWLAVLLLDEDDVAAFPGLKLTPASGTVADLLQPPGRYSSSDTDIPGDPVQFLDIPLALFWQIAPTLEDLKLTAHVRQVSLSNKSTGHCPDPLEPLGTFSIVVGTRLPQSQKKAHAYLVSLEAMEAILPTDAGPPAGDPNGSVRLAVLTHWTFFSTGDAVRFVHRLQSLNGTTPGHDAAITNLRLPYGGANPIVAAALKMGYVPLDETLRTGENAVSWYRGPLIPYETQKRELSLPISSPDQVTIFDPTTGMLDVSYAAAWTLGRMLALQDKGFSTALYNWKRGLSRQVVDAEENRILSETFDDVLAQSAAPQGPEATRPVPAAQALLHKTMRSLGAARRKEQ